jgi:alkylation response protein AidB-like acyl-CoA dehydrogenase
MQTVIKKVSHMTALQKSAVPSHRIGDDSWMNDSERELFTQALALVPKLKEREAQTLKNGHIAQETADEFKNLGLTRILQPKRYGGMQGSPLLL